MAEGKSSLKDDRASQPPDQGVGQPKLADQRSSDVLHIEIAKLQSDGEYLRRDVNEMRSDVKDVRDRLIKLETKADHLAGKEFIVRALVIGFTLLGAVLTVGPKVMSLLAVTPPSAVQPAAPTPTPPAAPPTPAPSP